MAACWIALPGNMPLSAAFAFAAAHFGDMHLHGGVRPLDDAAAAGLLRAQTEEAFHRYDVPAFVRLVDRAFDAAAHSLRGAIDTVRLVIKGFGASESSLSR